MKNLNSVFYFVNNAITTSLNPVLRFAILILPATLLLQTLLASPIEARLLWPCPCCQLCDFLVRELNSWFKFDWCRYEKLPFQAIFCVVCNTDQNLIYNRPMWWNLYTDGFSTLTLLVYSHWAEPGPRQEQRSGPEQWRPIPVSVEV